MIGSFFAIIFTAGHLTQEVRDFEADLRNGIRTNAVVFGKTKGFIAGFTLFTLAQALLVVLAINGIVPHRLILVGLTFPLQCYWSLKAISKGLTSACVRQLQARYRFLYAGIGVIMAISVLLKYSIFR